MNRGPRVLNKKNLYIYGYGGLGREIFSLATLVNKWNFKGFLEDDSQKISIDKKIYPYEILKNIDQETHIFISVADPQSKKKIFKKISSLKLDSIKFPKLLSPLAYIDSGATIGEGSIITHFCFVSCNTKIGSFSFFNANCSIGHDTTIGNFNSAMPGVAISGNVHTGECVFFGSKAFILQGKSISDNAFIGAGANVTFDLASQDRVYSPRSIKIKKR